MKPKMSLPQLWVFVANDNQDHETMSIVYPDNTAEMFEFANKSVIITDPNGKLIEESWMSFPLTCSLKERTKKLEEIGGEFIANIE